MHTLVLGHRGAPLEAPENTLRAFRLALRQGADGVELDVQRSRDGVPVILHDPTLQRTTDAAGVIAEMEWAEIARAHAGGTESVPRLEDVLAWAATEDAWLNVELKAHGIGTVCVRLVREADRAQRTIFSSFHADVVEELTRTAPDLRTFLLTETWDTGVLAEARRVRAAGVCLHDAAADGAALAELRRERLPVIVWTVDDPTRVAALAAAGVLAIITNRPAAVRTALDAAG